MAALDIGSLIASYGYWAVFAIVAVEGTGVPLPGETILVSAAVYAGTTQQLAITQIIVAAAAGAILGDNLGFWIGRKLGLPLLERYGHHIRLDARRLRLGQYLFRRHGGKIVFFGRFVAVLRTWAALLAGANRMGWSKFFFFNAMGAIAWATSIGLASYLFGASINGILGPIGIALLIVVVVAGLAGALHFRRHEERLLEQAEQALAASSKVPQI